MSLTRAVSAVEFMDIVNVIVSTMVVVLEIVKQFYSVLHAATKFSPSCLLVNNIRSYRNFWSVTIYLFGKLTVENIIQHNQKHTAEVAKRTVTVLEQ